MRRYCTCFSPLPIRLPTAGNVLLFSEMHSRFRTLLRKPVLLIAIFAALILRLRAAELLSPDETKLRTDRYRQLMKEAATPGGDKAAIGQRYEEAGRTLLKEFPTSPEMGVSMLIRAVEMLPADKGRALISEIIAGNFPESSKETARGVQRRLDAMGKPLDLRFTALDGRPVDLQSMRGKVILIDFWATWCGPCVAELPHVQAAYDQLHSRGFDVVGISFDSDKARLEKFLAERKMPWPQFFDGKGWENEFGRKFGIRGIPTMWLVDKKGVFRENTRQNLAADVEKLLGEP
jgi:thiol-disulfide isomerase/thioredoxin